MRGQDHVQTRVINLSMGYKIRLIAQLLVLQIIALKAYPQSTLHFQDPSRKISAQLSGHKGQLTNGPPLPGAKRSSNLPPWE